MVEMMADQNVASEIHAIHKRMDRTDDAVAKISEALHTLTSVMERQAFADREFTEFKTDVKDRLKSQDDKIDQNRQHIWRWSGGLAVAVMLIGIGVSVWVKLG